MSVMSAVGEHDQVLYNVQTQRRICILRCLPISSYHGDNGSAVRRLPHVLSVDTTLHEPPRTSFSVGPECIV